MSNTKGSYLPDNVYNALKFISLVLLPGLATLYLALTPVWNLPDSESVAVTITSIDTFIGVLLKLSNSAYNRGTAKYGGAIVIKRQNGRKVYSLEVEGDVEDLDQKKEVLFQIQRHPSPS